MEIVGEGANTESIQYIDGSSEDLGQFDWEILLCTNCYKYHVIQTYTDFQSQYFMGSHGNQEFYSDPEVTVSRLYPTRDVELPLPHPLIPDSIKEDYEEALDVFSLSARSACALLRLAIQKLNKELGEPGKNINDDIKNLVKKGLPEHIQQALDIVRVIGNDAVHPGVLNIKDNPDTAKKLFHLVNEIIEDRLNKPKRKKEIKTLFDELPESKRNQILDRDKDSN
jgi:hypothetical protein